MTITAGTLPSGAVYNPQTYFNAIVARMIATVSGGNVLWGQLGGSQPNGPLPGSDGQAGLWFGNQTGGQGFWNDYNADAAMYLPIPVLCGQSINGVFLWSDIICGAVTAGTIIATPDKSGTMALTSDIIQQLGAQTFSGTTNITIDWNNRAPVYIVMSAGLTTINMINSQNGMLIDFWLENPTQSGTFTFSMPTVWWDGGLGAVAPALSPGVAGVRVIDHVRVYVAAGQHFGQLVSKNYQIPVGSDHTLPAPVSAVVTANDNDITITMNAVVSGGNLATADFVIMVNGAQVATTAASCSGAIVTVDAASNVPKNATCTIKYQGTDMKSIAGNIVPAFGPIAVKVIFDVGGVHNIGGGPGGRGSPP
jgi:hypothetical protein